MAGSHPVRQQFNVSTQLQSLTSILGAKRFGWGRAAALIADHTPFDVNSPSLLHADAALPDTPKSLAKALGHSTLGTFITNTPANGGLGLEWPVWEEMVRATWVVDQYGVDWTTISAGRVLELNKAITTRLGSPAKTARLWHSTRSQIQEEQVNATSARLARAERHYKSLLNETSRKLQAALSEVESKTEALNTATNNIETLQSQLERQDRNFGKRLEGWKKDLRSSEREKLTLQREVADLHEQVESLEDKLAHLSQAEAELQQTQAMLCDAGHQMAEILEQLAVLQDSYSELDEAHAALNTEHQHALRDKAKALRRIEGLEANIVAAEAELESLSQDNQALASTIETLKQSNTARAVTDISAERDNLAAELANAKAELASARETAEDSARKLSAVLELDEISAGNTEAIYDLLTERDEAIAAANAQLSEMRQSLESARNNEQAAVSELRALRLDHMDLKVDFAALQRTYQLATTTLDPDFAENINQLNASIVSLEYHRDHLTATVKGKVAQVQSMLGIIKKAKLKIARMREVLSSRNRWIRSTHNVLRVQAEIVKEQRQRSTKLHWQLRAVLILALTGALASLFATYDLGLIDQARYYISNLIQF